MKITHKIEPITGNHKYFLEIKSSELVKIIPSNFTREAERIASLTGKISDILWALSEEADEIETYKEKTKEKMIKSLNIE